MQLLQNVKITDLQDLVREECGRDWRCEYRVLATITSLISQPVLVLAFIILIFNIQHLQLVPPSSHLERTVPVLVEIICYS